MSKYIIIQPVGTSHQDGSVDYEVKLNKNYSLYEFIRYVLFDTRNEYGNIRITQRVTQFDSYPKVHEITYKGKTAQYSLDEEVLNSAIEKVEASGCYGRMDYQVTLYP